jgi:hypothetical protein
MVQRYHVEVVIKRADAKGTVGLVRALRWAVIANANAKRGEVTR